MARHFSLNWAAAIVRVIWRSFLARSAPSSKKWTDNTTGLCLCPEKEKGRKPKPSPLDSLEPGRRARGSERLSAPRSETSARRAPGADAGRSAVLGTPDRRRPRGVAQTRPAERLLINYPALGRHWVNRCSQATHWPRSPRIRPPSLDTERRCRCCRSLPPLRSRPAPQPALQDSGRCS